jgi:hypothetical protein
MNNKTIKYVLLIIVFFNIVSCDNYVYNNYDIIALLEYKLKENKHEFNKIVFWIIDQNKSNFIIEGYRAKDIVTIKYIDNSNINDTSNISIDWKLSHEIYNFFLKAGIGPIIVKNGMIIFRCIERNKSYNRISLIYSKAFSPKELYPSYKYYDHVTTPKKNDKWIYKTEKNWYIISP